MEQGEHMEQISGIPPRIKRIAMDKYSQKPSKASVDLLPILKKFKMLGILKYDEISNPRDHVIA